MTNPWMHLYNSPRWHRLRANHLRRFPRCQCPWCDGQGPRLDDSPGADPELKAVVDHMQPHRGDRRLFFDAKNLRTMSKAHHDSPAQSEDKGGAGFDKGCDADGQPLNRSHSWWN